MIEFYPSRRLFNDDDEVNDLFNPRGFGGVIRTSILETKDSYLFEYEIAGVKKEDISLSYKDGYINLKVEKRKPGKLDENIKLLRGERTFGKFSRSFYIGEEVDENSIKASYVDGVLTVTINKRVQQPKSEKLISID